ncbi:MAG: class IV adenylate cyclase [Candidatus Acidiferrales bacterium]
MARGRLTRHEIEIKLRIADLTALIAQLRSIGAAFRGRVLEQNTLYDTPDFAFRRCGRLLRLRVETSAPAAARPAGPSRVVLTSKAPPPAPTAPRSSPYTYRRYKDRLESELTVRDASHWSATLRSLGFRPSFRYEKFRSTYGLPGLHLDLDETPVGVFLELEGMPRAIDRAARALGFSPRDYIRGTYWDLYAAECRRRGVIPKNMLLHA